jgi:hypothetical protein
MWLLPQWRSWHFLGGVLVSLAGLLPSAVWNMQHEWATFRHVGNTIWSKNSLDVGTTALIQGNFFEFLGAQAILFSPILFVLLVMGAWNFWKMRSAASKGVMFCAGVTGVLLAFYLVLSLFKRLQGNWVDFAYPTAMVFVGWYAWDRQVRLRRWLIGGVVLSALLSFFALSIPYFQSQRMKVVPFKANPFKHNVGSQNLALELQAAGYDSQQHFLVSDKYQITSLLSFYGTEQKRAYFLNLHGIRKNQFSYWPGMSQEQKGKTAFFVVIENMALDDQRWLTLEEEYKVLLAPYFMHVRFLGVRPLFYDNGRPVKGVMILKGIDYNGLEPEESGLY